MRTATFATIIGFGLAPFALAQSTSFSLPPAPEESFGCEPHGDHYHCEGHVSELSSGTVSGAVPTATGDQDHDHEHEHEHSDDEHSHDHDHGDEDEADAEEAGPSPTESIGCEPHGDHWHCDGPRETGTGTGTGTDSAAVETETAGDDEGIAAGHMVPLAGAFIAALVAL